MNLFMNVILFESRFASSFLPISFTFDAVDSDSFTRFDDICPILLVQIIIRNGLHNKILIALNNIPLLLNSFLKWSFFRSKQNKK